VDVQSRQLTLKDAKLEWECANKASEDCHCGPITPEHEVIEIHYDIADGIRCHVTMPDMKRGYANYARSFRCAAQLVKAHLRSKAKKVDPSTMPPKMATRGNRL
jgi:hypothetical protein